MGRIVWAVALWALLGGLAAAGDGVRLLGGESRVADRWRGLEIELALTGVARWRVFTLDGPRRLVVDLGGVNWDGGEPGEMIQGDNALGLRLGPVAGGWSRLVVELDRPLEVVEAGMAVEEGGARLRILAEATSEAEFAAAAGAPEAEPAAEPPAPAASPDDGRFVVAIDPGHGGIDPGAERDGVREAQVMLALAVELRAALEAAGIEAVLTRAEDVFVPLPERMTRARAGGADVLLSLHADALEADAASGASLYTLSNEAVGEASERMVARHEGGDLIAGLDLRGEGDEVATALMDLARLDTGPRSERLAAALVAGLGRAGAALNGRALRQANLAVLGAADFPSVLIEAGFLSDGGDRARLSSPQGRAPIVRGLVAGLEAWAEAEAALGGRLRR